MSRFLYLNPKPIHPLFISMQLGESVETKNSFPHSTAQEKEIMAQIIDKIIF